MKALRDMIEGRGAGGRRKVDRIVASVGAIMIGTVERRRTYDAVLEYPAADKPFFHAVLGGWSETYAKQLRPV